MEKQDFIKNNFFIGIGAQKAGTTWLGEYLMNHKEVCFSPLKELHYFNAEYSKICKGYHKRYTKLVDEEITLLNENKENKKKEKHHRKKIKVLLDRLEMICDEKLYIEHFLPYHTNQKICGEITPAYSVLEADGFLQMKRLIPNVKIFYILRNPIDRYWSHLRYTSMKIKDFNPTNEFHKSLSDVRFSKRSDYKSTIINLNQAFDSKQIHILFYENLFDKTKHEKTLKQLTDFLNISYEPSNNDKVVRSSIKQKFPPELRKEGILHFREQYEYINDLFEDIPLKWKKDMEYL